MIDNLEHFAKRLVSDSRKVRSNQRENASIEHPSRPSAVPVVLPVYAEHDNV